MNFREWLEKLPEWFYHVTIDPDGIMKHGFLTAEQLGGGSEVLGGSISNAVSFTTKENAEGYFEGLKIWMDAAQGKYSFNELGKNAQLLVHIEKRFQGNARKVWSDLEKEKYKFHLNYGKQMEEKLMFNLLQRISMYSKGKFPLIMGSNFPERLKTNKKLAILKVSSAGPQNVKWHAGEHEWKVHDPEKLNLSTLEVVKIIS